MGGKEDHLRVPGETAVIAAGVVAPCAVLCVLLTNCMKTWMSLKAEFQRVLSKDVWWVELLGQWW